MRARSTCCWTLALASVLVACASPPSARPLAFPARPAIALPDTLTVRTGGRVQTVDLEDYVLGTVLGEVSPVDETTETAERIFELQSVIARTYAVSRMGRHRDEGFDLCDTTHCQIFDPSRVRTSRFATIAREAVDHTAGRVLTFNARPIEALFHSDCGGSTTSADAVWGGPAVPYLRPIVDELPAPAHRPWQVEAPVTTVRAALAADSRTDVGRTLKSISITTVDPSGRAAEVEIAGDRTLTTRGDTLRAVLNRRLGDRAIQSTRFTVTRIGASFRFEGTGFGHGVGLCQRGAAARLRRGDAVADVLRVYYSGVAISGSR